MTDRRMIGGRPVYRVHEIPTGMATVTTLRRMRLQLADGQAPAGVLFYHGNKHTDLFEIATAEPMPALSPGRQRRWTHVRTCVRCGVQDADPLVEFDGRRLHWECRGLEVLAAADDLPASREEDQ